jgi:hypothetical protein
MGGDECLTDIPEMKQFYDKNWCASSFFMVVCDDGWPEMGVDD